MALFLGLCGNQLDVSSFRKVGFPKSPAASAGWGHGPPVAKPRFHVKTVECSSQIPNEKLPLWPLAF